MHLLFLLMGSLAIAVGASAQSGNIGGTVMNPFDTGLPGATVTITDSKSSESKSATTGANGEYSFTGLGSGPFDISVVADGYRKASRRGVPAGDSSMHVDVRLDWTKEEPIPALKQAEEAVAAKPDDSRARVNLGRRLMVTDLAKAQEQFEKAVAIQPDNVQARILLVQVCLRRGDGRAALRTALELRTQKPENAAAKLLVTTVYMRTGQVDQAQELLNGILKQNPYDLDALLTLAMVNVERKQFGDAETLFRRAYTVDPGDLRGLTGIEEIHYLFNEPDKAVAVIATESQKDPQRPDLRRELGKAELKAHQYEKAIADFQAAAEQYKDFPGDQPLVLALLAEGFLRNGQPERGVEPAKKALQMDPNNVGFQTMAAEVYDLTGQKKESLALYRDVLKTQPENGYVMNNMAYLIIQTGGDVDEALSFAQRARRQLPDSLEVQDTIGWIYLKKGLIDSATRVFEEIVGKAPQTSTFHYHLGVALAQKGDKQGALKELNLALERKPTKIDEEGIRDLIRKLS